MGNKTETANNLKAKPGSDLSSEESYKLAAAIVQNIQIGLYIYKLEDPEDIEGTTLTLILANEAAEQMTGLPFKDLSGKTIDENFPALRKKGIPQIYSRVARSGVAETLEDIIYSDERIVESAYSVKTFPLPDGHVGVSFENITERISAQEKQEELRKGMYLASKLAAIGELAAGAGHEINNPLAIIKGNVNLIKGMSKKKNDKMTKFLLAIEGAIDRIASIVDGLRTHARISTGKTVIADIHELINETVELLGPIYSRTEIVFQKEFNATQPRIATDTGKFQQILINLISNAHDSMSEAKGTVRIATSNLEDRIIIEVSDSGIGISEANIGKIYDTFFTTKTSDKGTGLGLAITRSLILEMEGSIDVKSTPGSGTSFFINLPATFSKKSPAVI